MKTRLKNIDSWFSRHFGWFFTNGNKYVPTEPKQVSKKEEVKPADPIAEERPFVSGYSKRDRNAKLYREISKQKTKKLK